MGITYRNAPLIELIAELRWGQPQFLLGQPAHLDALYIQYGSLIAARGFTRLERLLPPEVPVGPYQVVYRYRSQDPSPGCLYQMGNGVFTTNAIPPYRSWDTFVPIAASGVEALLETFRNQNQPLPTFNSALLRYINAFRPALTQGKSISDFLSDTLGLKLVLPEILHRLCTDPSAIAPTIQLTMPVEVGQLSMVFAQGQVDNEAAVIMDVTIFIQREIAPDVEQVINQLSEARAVIHEIFEGVSAPIKDLLGPEEMNA